MTEKTYMWENFRQHPKEVQDKLLKEFQTLLDGMTAKEQAQAFEGAPGIVILEFLPSLAWDVQAEIWKKYLPVRDRENAMKLLKEDALVKLRLKPKQKLYKSSWLS